MTEKEFLKLFNDIDDKFIKEEQEEINPIYPVKPKPAVKSFAWGRFAAAAAACTLAAGGGLFAARHFVGNGSLWAGNTTTVPFATAAENSTDAAASDTVDSEKPPVTSENPSDPSGELPRDQQPVLYETVLSCNGQSYDLTVLMHRIRSDESLDGAAQLDQNYIWGDVALELSLNGEVKSTLWVYEYCYGLGEVGGMPFDKVNFGNDYFRVLNMEQDVLAYITPNKPFGTADENEGLISNAMFFTVDRDDNLVCFQRYVDGELTVADGCYFKITPDYDIQSNYLVLFLKDTVKNPWTHNNSVFEAEAIPVFFEFENYNIVCEYESYKSLVYNLTEPWYPPLLLMDGSYAPNSEILGYDKNTAASGSTEFYSVDVCYAVPFFTPAENRIAGTDGAWIKFKKGFHIGDFYVNYARSDYSANADAGFYPYSYQCKVELHGELSCTGTATAQKVYYDGYLTCINITLDREYCENLFSLEPSIGTFDGEYADAFTKTFDNEGVHFILTEKTSDYYRLLERMENADSIRVAIKAEKFSLSYGFGSGEAFDGMSLIDFEEGSYTLEILDY